MLAAALPRPRWISVAARAPQRPPGPQARRQVSTQSTAGLDIQRLVVRLGRHPHLRIVRELAAQTADDLLRRVAPEEIVLHPAAQLHHRHELRPLRPARAHIRSRVRLPPPRETVYCSSGQWFPSRCGLGLARDEDQRGRSKMNASGAVWGSDSSVRSAAFVVELGRCALATTPAQSAERQSFQPRAVSSVRSVGAGARSPVANLNSLPSLRAASRPTAWLAADSAKVCSFAARYRTTNEGPYTYRFRHPVLRVSWRIPGHARIAT
jgi:hypothetical protein